MLKSKIKISVLFCLIIHLYFHMLLNLVWKEMAVSFSLAGQLYIISFCIFRILTFPLNWNKRDLYIHHGITALT